jgi:phosphopantothenoylcysteine decarboxylase/phosphopantothenate--cysteine ligase
MLKKKILLGVTGSIAAYKSADLIRQLRQNDYFVQVIMTKSAKEFITPLTLQALSGNPVLENMWDSSEGNGMEHISLSRNADLILIAPSSANFIAKLAHGNADDLLSNLCLARKCPLLVAPAMNVEMYKNNATQRNINLIRKDGVLISGPENGEHACGDHGMGRLINFESLILDVEKSMAKKIFKGKHILISSGATFEKIDEARAITNLSSGLMGLNLAKAAYKFGAEVTVIRGKSNYNFPPCIKIIEVDNHSQMQKFVNAEIKTHDIYISAAAISDYKPKPMNKKIKKEKTKITIDLFKTEDILGTIGLKNKNTFLVGFAAESEDLEKNAMKKLVEKKLDIVVGNLINESMGKTSSTVTIIDKSGKVKLQVGTKTDLSLTILEHIFKIYSKEKKYELIN